MFADVGVIGGRLIGNPGRRQNLTEVFLRQVWFCIFQKAEGVASPSQMMSELSPWPTSIKCTSKEEPSGGSSTSDGAGDSGGSDVSGTGGADDSTSLSIESLFLIKVKVKGTCHPTGILHTFMYQVFKLVCSNRHSRMEELREVICGRLLSQIRTKQSCCIQSFYASINLKEAVFAVIDNMEGRELISCVGQRACRCRQ